jgi:ferrous iron transport protein A
MVHMLSSVPVGQKVRLISIHGGRKLTRRLLSLGVAQGSELEVLHHRSGGVVVGRGGNRVALGAGVADKLMIEVLTDGVL